MKNMPLVSVLITTYQAEPWIQATLNSVLGQTIRNLDVVVVDDASTDKTCEIVERTAAVDRRVRLIRHDFNTGLPAATRNTGLAALMGNWVAFLDGDDLWRRRKLERQLRAMHNQSLASSVHSQLIAWSNVPHLRAFASRAEKVASSENLRVGNRIQLSAVLAPRKLVDTTGAFCTDFNLRGIEDLEYWQRLAEHGPIAYIPEVHGLYRVHERSVTRSRDVGDVGRITQPGSIETVPRAKRYGARIRDLLEGELRYRLGLPPSVCA